jgi:putative hydrolase of the HAD superfamily
MQPKALFFDLDDTLIDDASSVSRSVEAVHRTLQLEAQIPLATFAETFARVSESIWTNNDTLLWDLKAARLLVWRNALVAHGLHDEAMHLLARDAYTRARLEAILFADTIAVLKKLHGRISLAVITNGNGEGQRGKMRAAGIDRYFDLIVGIDDGGALKPDGAIFRHALERLSLEPADVWHVGDSLLHDVAGAHNAGLRSVWYNYRGRTLEPHHPQPHYEIASLTDLLALLEKQD